MTTPEHQSNGSFPAAKGSPDIEQIQATIEQTREELGETVGELTAKLDVKARSKARLTDIRVQSGQKVKDVQGRASELSRSARASATDDHGNPKPALLAGAAGVAALAVTTIILAAVRMRRRHGTPVTACRTH